MSAIKQIRVVQPNSTRYVLTEVRVEGISGLFHRSPRFATIQVDEGDIWTFNQLKVDRRGILSWKGDSNARHFTATPSSTLVFKLYKAEDTNKELGTLYASPLSCVSLSPDTPFRMRVQSNLQKHAHVTLVISKDDDPQTSGRAVEVVPSMIENGERTTKSNGSADKTWTPLLENLNTFRYHIEKHSMDRVHPYAKITFSLLLHLVYKANSGQLHFDEKIQTLGEKLKNTYNAVLAQDHFRTLNEVYGVPPGKLDEARQAIYWHAQTFLCLAVGTMDCVLTISEYMQERHYLTKLGQPLLSSASEELDRFSDKFDELTRTLRDHSIFSTDVEDLRLFKDVGRIQLHFDFVFEELEKNAVFPAIHWSSNDGCLEGTRTWMLDRIKTWHWNESKNDSERVYLLLGEAGTGKSAIAKSIAEYFSSEPRRLGVSYRFGAVEGNTESATGERLQGALPTIAWQLSHESPFFKAALWRSFCAQPMTEIQRADFRFQLEEYLLGPADHIPPADDPVYLVLDGLDRIGDVDDRKRLLTLLSNGLARLPTNFRILLTARPEKDVLEIFEQRPDTLPIRIPSVAQDQTLLQDIVSVIRDELLYEKGFDESDYENLAKISQGSFGFARLACDYILGSGRGNDGSPQERYKVICKQDEELGGRLYEHVRPYLVELGEVGPYGQLYPRALRAFTSVASGPCS